MPRRSTGGPPSRSSCRTSRAGDLGRCRDADGGGRRLHRGVRRDCAEHRWKANCSYSCSDGRGGAAKHRVTTSRREAAVDSGGGGARDREATIERQAERLAAARSPDRRPGSRFEARTPSRPAYSRWRGRSPCSRPRGIRAGTPLRHADAGDGRQALVGREPGRSGVGRAEDVAAGGAEVELRSAPSPAVPNACR